MPANASKPFAQRLTPSAAALNGPHADIAAMGVIETAECIQRRDLSCTEVTVAYLDRIEALDGAAGLNAYLTLDPELALEQARDLDRVLAANDYRGPLHGVPMAIKDALDPSDLPTTGGTKPLQGIPVRQDLAMTGEITLRGKVLPVGGLKHKLLAAYRAGLTTVLVPKDNERDLDELPDEVRETLDIQPVESMDEVLRLALEGEIAPAPKGATGFDDASSKSPTEPGPVAH